MGETDVLIRFDAKQTNHGLELTNPEGLALDHLGAHNESTGVSAWPKHLFVPRLFYLWALDQRHPPGLNSWVLAEAGKIEFYLQNGWASYGLAHAASGGGHWDLLDSGAGV